MSAGIWSILPPIIAITMVLITKRVLISLGAGIVSGMLFVSLVPGSIVTHILEALLISFWEAGELNTSRIFIMLFILLLGVLTAFSSLSGGSRAFADWAIGRVKTKRGAKFLTAFLGIIIFIDDYFNALAVGQIARPITDRHQISRAKLAYFIDSTSAPICVISPISSWGAFLIGQLALIFGAAAVGYSPLSAFVLMAPMNFYVVVTLLMVFFFAWSNIDFFEMKKHEVRASQTGYLFDPDKEIPGELKEDFPEHTHGRVVDLVAPIVTLIVVTISMMVYTGYQAAGVANIWAIFENTDVPKSLVSGGMAASLLAVLLYCRQMKYNETASSSLALKALVSGVKAMMPAVLILIFAWILTHLIELLGTGIYLSTVVDRLNIPLNFIPAIMFILAGFMAFSTGTSWGSFGILLPIAGTIMLNAHPDLLLPALAAVLAGSVFGDHCSPISDTTILSSTGAGCNHLDHVDTQLPYALIAACISLIGYVVLGITGSIWVGLIVVLSIVVLLFSVWIAREKKEENSATL